MAEFSDASLLALVERHRNELRLHCYRMLGSSHDSDDVLQETMLRAWRAKATLEDPSRVRPWLYRIATNVCIDELARRRARMLSSDVGPPAPLGGAPLPPDRDEWLEPCPDVWLQDVQADPAARYRTNESVVLAFVAALQHLTPSQRATLLLRDVVGLSAEETATALELGLEATNSALFRARAAVEKKLGGREPSEIARESAVDEALLERYVRAWHDVNLGAFVALLHDDVKTTMPPSPTWISGRDANVVFYAPMFGEGRKGTVKLVRTSANGQPALAFYRAAAQGEPRPLRAIQLLEGTHGSITRIDHFMIPAIFRLFDIPAYIV